MSPERQGIIDGITKAMTEWNRGVISYEEALKRSRVLIELDATIKEDIDPMIDEIETIIQQYRIGRVKAHRVRELIYAHAISQGYAVAVWNDGIEAAAQEVEDRGLAITADAVRRLKK